MDFWDVAKLMWRRWYVTVPALLLTAAAALWTGLNVSPDYQVTGHVAVVGPAIQRSESDSAVTHVNPWSPEALADAATIRLQGKPLSDALEAEGYSGEWGAVVTGRLPVIRLEVIATQPEHAQATLERLREVIDEEVRNRQNEYNVAPEEQITTVPYDGGETVEAVTGKVKRALIVVVGAGLILTTGLVVAFDAIARRRRARKLAQAEPALDQPPAAGRGAPQARYQYPRERAATGSAAVPVAGHANGSRTGVPAANARASHPVRVQYSTDQASSAPGSPATASPAAAPSSPPGLNEAESKSPDDSTIVLPLSNSRYLHHRADDQDSSAGARTH